MKITVWTLAWDTDFGTGAEVFSDEVSALSALFNMAVEDHVEPHDLERVRALFWEDQHDVVAIYKSEMDTFSHDRHTVEISLMDVIRQTIRAEMSDRRVIFRRWLAAIRQVAAAKREAFHNGE